MPPTQCARVTRWSSTASEEEAGRQQFWRRERREARHLAKATKGGTEPVPVELRLVHKERLDKCKGDEAELNGKLKRMNDGHSVVGKMTEKRRAKYQHASIQCEARKEDLRRISFIKGAKVFRRSGPSSHCWIMVLISGQRES